MMEADMVKKKYEVILEMLKKVFYNVQNIKSCENIYL